MPGTNGPDIRQSGMPVWGNGMSAQGSTDSWNPYTRFDPTYTAAANVTKLAGTHSFRFGAAVDHQAMNHWQPEVRRHGPRGRLDFSGNLSGLRGGPQTPNFYNQYASFLLGLTLAGAEGHSVGGHDDPRVAIRLLLRRPLAVASRRDARSGRPLRVLPAGARAPAVAASNASTSTPWTCCSAAWATSRATSDSKTSKTDFAPRLGVAWRVNEGTVARAGYGLTYNPLPFARPLRGAYPLTIHNTYVSLNSWQPYGTLGHGIPEFTGPGPGRGPRRRCRARRRCGPPIRTT